MKKTVFTLALLFSASVFGTSAFAKTMSLDRLPADKLVALGPALVGGTIGLVESNPNGVVMVAMPVIAISSRAVPAPAPEGSGHAPRSTGEPPRPAHSRRVDTVSRRGVPRRSSTSPVAGVVLGPTPALDGTPGG